MVYAHLQDRQGNPLSDDYEVSGDDFEAVEQAALNLGRICCIRWNRTSDGQVAYWTPKGVSFEPFWYGAGQPRKDPSELKRPMSLKLSPFVMDWLDAQDTPKAQMIETAIIEYYKIKRPA